MCGYPGSGKSTFVDLIGRYCEVHVVRPSDWYDDFKDYENYQIACWEYALEKTGRLLAAYKPSDLIILDTCGAGPMAFNTIFGVAALHHHKIIMLGMGVPISVCAQRRDRDIIEKYKDRLKGAMSAYKRLCDEIIIIKDGTLDVWAERARDIAIALSAVASNTTSLS